MFFGKLISRAIFRSQFYTTERKNAIIQKSKSESEQVDQVHNNFKIKIKNKPNTILDVTEYQYKKTDANQTITKPKIIINAFGRNDCYERHTTELIKQADLYKNNNIIIVGFNFRNIMYSQGEVYTQQDWIDDVIAVVDHYVTKYNIPLDSILLYGHSMGAAFTTMAAAQIYEREQNINTVKIINDRSFKNLPSVATRLVFGTRGAGIFVGAVLGVLSLVSCFYLGFLGLICSATVFLSSVTLSKIYPALILKTCELITNIILFSTFGTMDVASAFKKLPDDSKEYFFIKHDPVITKDANLAYDSGIRSIRKQLEHKHKKKHCKFVADHKSHSHDSHDDYITRKTHDLPFYLLKTASKKIGAVSAQIVLDIKIRELLKI